MTPFRGNVAKLTGHFVGQHSWPVSAKNAMQRHDAHEDGLDARLREVLHEIVLQYIHSGEPISSRSLSKGGRFRLSPATLRNAMADLEDLGYLYQPHTSAGRVPSDRGYRFFINHLMKTQGLTRNQCEAIDEQVANATEFDDVMHLASRLLSKMSDQVGVAFTPKLHHLAMRSIDFILVADKKIMCIIVGANGVVVNKVIETAASFTRDELEKIGRYLTVEYAGLDLVTIRDRLVALARQERARYDQLLQKTLSLGIDAVEDLLPYDHELVLEGATSILNKPEFADADAMRRILTAFEEKEKLIDLLNRCLNEDGLQILIGSENPFTRNYNFAVVASRYGSKMNPVGVVGVIGPTRMEYARMGPLVEYLGKAISRKIEEGEASS
jgi:heat-inducible transcriptional repressor